MRARQQPWFQTILSPDYGQYYDQKIDKYIQHSNKYDLDPGQQAAKPWFQNLLSPEYGQDYEQQIDTYGQQWPIYWFQNFLPPEYGYGQRNLKSGIGSSQKFHESYKPVHKPLGEVGFVILILS